MVYIDGMVIADAAAPPSTCSSSVTVSPSRTASLAVAVPLTTRRRVLSLGASDGVGGWGATHAEAALQTVANGALGSFAVDGLDRAIITVPCYTEYCRTSWCTLCWLTSRGAQRVGTLACGMSYVGAVVAGAGVERSSAQRDSLCMVP